LQAPILAPALERIRGEGGEIEEIVLIATDQDPVAAEKFYNTDTVFVGRILERLLPARGWCRAVRLWTIPGVPNDHEAMMKFFEQRMGEEPPPEQGEVRYALISGGTPAANLALMFVASVAWGLESCRVWAGSERGSGQEFPLARRIVERDRAERARVLIGQRQIGALRHVFPPDSELGLLGRMAHEREHLNIEEAARAARELIECAKKSKPSVDEKSAQGRLKQYQELERELGALDLGGRPGKKRLQPGKAHLAEVFWQAKWFLGRAQWNEMLARLYHLSDTLQDWALRCWLVHNPIMDLKQGLLRNKDISANAELCRRICERKNLDTPLRLDIINWARERLKVQGEPAVDIVCAALELLKPMQNLRADSLAGHGFRSLSAKELERIAGGRTLDNLLGDLENQLREMGVLSANSIRESPWECIARLAATLL